MVENAPQLFHKKYKKAVAKLLDIPLVAVSLYKKDYIPYEYASEKSTIRFKRDRDDIINFLKKEPEFALCCMDNNITIGMLQVFRGGNLFSYAKNIQSIRKVN